MKLGHIGNCQWAVGRLRRSAPVIEWQYNAADYAVPLERKSQIRAARSICARREPLRTHLPNQSLRMSACVPSP